jgi:hypothetical protein
MWCEKCAFYSEEPAATVCRGCGRYLHNKQGQLVITALFAIGLSLFSHYIFTGTLASGTLLTWLQTALAAPCSIYESPAYMAVVALTLSGLVMIAALAAFTFGMGPGLLLAFVVGLMSGVYMGALAFPAIAAVAGIPGTKRVPPLAWLVLSVAGGSAYYLALGWHYGPANAPLYRNALMEFLSWTAFFSAILAIISGLLAVLVKHNSLQVTATAAVLALAPAFVFFRGVGPAQLEARIIEFTCNPAKWLNSPLPEGFASGAAATPTKDLVPERQMGHVLDTVHYVDAIRVKTIEACDEYLRRYPLGRDSAEIIMLKAQMHNTRMDVGVLKRYNRLETYSDRIAEMATPLYKSIADRLPGTPEAALSRYYLAVAAFQAGKVTEARALFAGAQRALSVLIPPSYYPVDYPPPAMTADLYRAAFARQDRARAKIYEALVSARRTQALIANNSDFGGQPLARFATLDPRSETFAVDAANLIATYQTSQIVDNVKEALAERLTDPVERRNVLDALLEEYPRSDIADKMLLMGAKADLAGDLAGDGPRRSGLKLRRLLADFPSSTYYPDAKSLLGKVTAAEKKVGAVVGTRDTTSAGAGL